MSKKTNVQPSVEEAKRRLELYNSLSAMVADVPKSDRREIMSELAKYVQKVATDQQMPLAMRQKYYRCCEIIFDFLYKSGQVMLSHVGFDRNIRNQVNDVLITIANEYDAG